jgi:hypothetical protein
MTKYIEILDKRDREGYFELNYKLTIDLPAFLQPYYNNELTTSTTGVLSCNLADGVPAVKAKLLALWNEFSTTTINNPKWKYYGSYWDGSTWTLGGIN